MRRLLGRTLLLIMLTSSLIGCGLMQNATPILNSDGACSVFQPIYLSDAASARLSDGVHNGDVVSEEIATDIVQHNQVYEHTCGANG